MSRIIIQVENGLLEHLDRAAKEERVSRSALVREAIVLLLAERHRRRELQQVIDSYTERPQEEDWMFPPSAMAWPDS